MDDAALLERIASDLVSFVMKTGIRVKGLSVADQVGSLLGQLTEICEILDEYEPRMHGCEMNKDTIRNRVLGVCRRAGVMEQTLEEFYQDKYALEHRVSAQAIRERVFSDLGWTIHAMEQETERLKKCRETMESMLRAL